jgi:plastocyanin
VGSIFIMGNLHHNMTPDDKSLKLAGDEGISQVEGKKTGACQEVYANHQVVITNGVANPSYTNASLCDTLTFTRLDNVNRKLTFGPYPKHEAYAGETDLTLSKGRAETITLSQTGTYQFYDLLNPGTAGYFTVRPR